MKTKQRQEQVASDNAEARLTDGQVRRCRGGTHTPGVLQKSLQAVENKGSEREKERKERKRVRKSLARQELRARNPADRLGADGAPGRRSVEPARRRGSSGGKNQWRALANASLFGAGFAVGGLGGRFFLASPILSCAGVALKWRAGLSRGSAYVVD
jgi:hypothetical protein